MNRNFWYILFIVLVTDFISCSKDVEVINSEVLYGKWRIDSYGDTITFANKNGADIATFRVGPGSLNPTKPRLDRNFIFRNGKLEIQGAGADFYRFESFAWTSAGNGFRVSGSDWFGLVATDLAYVIFTKIP